MILNRVGEMTTPFFVQNEFDRLRAAESEAVCKVLQLNYELIEEIQKLISDLTAQNTSLLYRHFTSKGNASRYLSNSAHQLPTNNPLQSLGLSLSASTSATSQLLNPLQPTTSGLPSPLPSKASLNGMSSSPSSSASSSSSPTQFKHYLLGARDGAKQSPSPPSTNSPSPTRRDSGEETSSTGSNPAASWEDRHVKGSLTYLYVGHQLVALIEELREVAEDKELNAKTAEERLTRTYECLDMLKDLLGLGEAMSLERLIAVARDPDSLQESERDLYYYSVLKTYLNIPPNKHGMKPEHLLWSQEKVRHYIDETRISHIWKEICPLKEWVFHKSLEKKTGKRQKISDSINKIEKRTQYQNWPAVVFPLLLKDHFLYKIRKVQPGIPEPGVVNNTVLAHRRLRRDQERFRKQAKI